jgi:hypothetical protein
MNEEALAHWGLLRQKQTNKQTNTAVNQGQHYLLVICNILQASRNLVSCVRFRRFLRSKKYVVWRPVLPSFCPSVIYHQRLIRLADFLEIWCEFFRKICQGSVSVLKFGGVTVNLTKGHNLTLCRP